MTTLASILAKLDAAVRAGEQAGDAIAQHDLTPFARILLQQTRQATGQLRQQRDMLKKAMLETKKP